MLKNFVLERMRSVEIKTNKWYAPGHVNRTLNYTRMGVIKKINKFIETLTMTGDEVKLGLYFNNSDGLAGSNGPFNREGLNGLLESIEMKRRYDIAVYGCFDGLCRWRGKYMSQYDNVYALRRYHERCLWNLETYEVEGRVTGTYGCKD